MEKAEHNAMIASVAEKMEKWTNHHGAVTSLAMFDINSTHFRGKGKYRREMFDSCSICGKYYLLTNNLYKHIEDTKYNAQIAHINSAADGVRSKLRRLDDDATVVDQSTKFNQRVGANDHEPEEDIFS